MRIENIRYGHATNSSSTHSVVIAREPVHEIRTKDAYFGWDCFRLVGRESKRAYFLAQLKANMPRDPSALERARFLSMFKDFAEDFVDLADPELADIPDIDHQSVIELPQGMPSADERAFWEGFFRFLMSDEVVVVGGNDNDDDNPALEFAHVRSDVPLRGSIGRRSKFKRHSDVHWTAYDPAYGDKIRFSFDPASAPLTKGLDPELVDVKITDYCPFGCSFCYQSSTKAGRHADLAYLEALFAQLARRGVFEVALGGGEPTMHPDFPAILAAARRVGLTVNFTTFSKAWLKDEAIVAAVKEHVGGIGVSVHDQQGLANVRAITDAISMRYPAPEVTAQHVFGSLPAEETLALVAACAGTRRGDERPINLLLLGWKSFGFASGNRGHDLADEALYAKIRAIYDDSYGRLAIDTAMIDNHPGLLRALGTHPCLLTPGEGRFSAYVDAVTKRIAASSYTNESLLYETIDDEAFVRAWATF